MSADRSKAMVLISLYLYYFVALATQLLLTYSYVCFVLYSAVITSLG